MAMMNSRNILRIFLATISLVWGTQVNALMASDHTILVSTFSDSSTENVPSVLHQDWSIKVWNGVPDVQVLKERDLQVLRLRSQQSSISVQKRLQLDIKKYSHVTWEWKVTSLPNGADARNGHYDDQAAGLYVVFPRFPAFFNSRIIGYVWDTTAPVGTVLESQNNSKVHYIVVRSGSTDIGKWQMENRDVLADYIKIFEEAPPMIGGVSLMIDSDHTQSSAESYFREIRFAIHSEDEHHQNDAIENVVQAQATVH